MKQIKIGVISNISGIYPKMGRNFNEGLLLGLEYEPTLKKEFSIETVVDIIQKTDHESISAAIFKQINIDDVDIVTGIINQNVLSIIIENIRTKKVPFIISNLGEFMPKKSVQAENLFGNSLNLWQSQWAMGKWAQEKYGGTPYIYYSIYDAGYQIASAFQMGAIEAGAKSVECRMLQMQPNLIDTSALVEQIKIDKPTHAHVVLCGVDAKDFLKRIHESGLRSSIPITVCPFVVEEGLMDDVEEYIEDYPNAITWSRYLNSDGNVLFVNKFYKQYDFQPNVFNLLGYETGIAIGEAFCGLKDEPISYKLLVDKLDNRTFNGPRGKHNLKFQEQDFDVCLRNTDVKPSGEKNKIQQNIATIKPSDPSIGLAAEQNVSGWQNPYLCI